MYFSIPFPSQSSKDREEDSLSSYYLVGLVLILQATFRSQLIYETGLTSGSVRVTHPLSVMKASAWALGRNRDDLRLTRAVTSAGGVFKNSWNIM